VDLNSSEERNDHEIFDLHLVQRMMITFEQEYSAVYDWEPGGYKSTSLYHLYQAADKPAAARVRSCRQADDGAEILRGLGYYIMQTV
jgi:hypothetical protein